MSHKKKEDKDPNHVTTRPYPSIIFQNYDYAGTLEGDETSPGTGFFRNLDKVKSVEDFLDKKHKARKIRQAEFYLALSALHKITS